VLGIDFGRTRIGLAVMDTEYGIPTARNPIIASGTLRTDADALDTFAKREEAARIVLGLPLENGEEGKSARIIRMLGELLEQKGWPVSYVDETLTSHEAETAMSSLGFKASEQRARVDGEAACLILERFQEAE